MLRALEASMRSIIPLLAVGMMACTSDKADDTGSSANTVTGVWLEEATYEWDYFNHRLSHATLVVDEDGADIAVIGGTSTTGVDPELPDGCSSDTCNEFPFKDNAIVSLGWGRIETDEAALGSDSIELIADAGGITDTLEIVLEGGISEGDEVAAVLQGFSLDTDYPLTGGDSCYDPALGWHVKNLAIELGEPEITSDGTLQVDVSVRLAAGASVEEVRECVDSVTDQAQVPITVHVLGISTSAAVSSETISHSMSYEYEDSEGDLVEQPDPDMGDRPLGLDDSLVGWSALDFSFHVDDPDNRGAYIRKLSVAHSVSEGWASGHSNNYSPPTQLSGYDYAFEGRLTGVDLSASAQRGTILETLPAELDANSDAVVTSVPLE